MAIVERTAQTEAGHLATIDSTRVEGEPSVKAFLGASEDLIKNIHGIAKVAGLNGDEVGYLAGKIAEIKRQR